MEYMKSGFGVGSVAAIAILFLAGGCKEDTNAPSPATPMETTEGQREVEVAPGEWVTIRREDRVPEFDPTSMEHALATEPSPVFDEGSTRMEIPWKGKVVVWEGCPVPFCLRAWEGNLYVIGLDRREMMKCKFRYYQQEGERFSPIRPEQFPKRIATQNMWLKADDYSTGKDGQRIYSLRLAREMDPGNIYFNGQLTAQVWLHLTKGLDYYETDGEIDKASVREYKEKYAPIALPTIIRTPEGWPEE